jgi:two-component system, OmpR family, KDP operon response regulator KdpE
MTPEPLVLAVDDEAGILRLMKLELTGQGFRVITASNGEEAMKLVEEQRPDVLLLDVIMPEMTGLEVMRRVREQMNIPIIMVTAKDSDQDKVRGLEMGADDYIVKPFSPEEMGARIRAVLRRAIGNQNTERVIKVQDVEIDLNRRIMTRNGEVVSLTRTEWLLLQYLAANAGKVMLNAELLSKVWGPEYHDDVQYLRVWVSRLRRKLEPNPNEPVIIKTMQGIGYMLDAEPAASASSTNPG